MLSACIGRAACSRPVAFAKYRIVLSHGLAIVPIGAELLLMANIPPSSRAARAAALSKINSGVIPLSRCFTDIQQTGSSRDWSGSGLYGRSEAYRSYSGGPTKGDT